MTTMIAEVYDALKSAGAEEDKALAAATAIADYRRDIADLRGDVRPILWMVAFNLAFSLAVVMLLVRLLAFATV